MFHKTPIIGFFNSMDNDMVLLDDIDEKNIHLDDLTIIKDYKDTLYSNQLKKIFNDFFQTDDIVLLMDFYVQAENANYKGLSSDDFLKKTNVMLSLNTVNKEFVSTLQELAGCIFKPGAKENISSIIEQTPVVKFYQSINKLKADINTITIITKQDLVNEKIALIRQKYVKDLSALYSHQAIATIKSSASNLIEKLNKENDFKTIKALSSALDIGDWFSAEKLLRTKNETITKDYAQFSADDIQKIKSKSNNLITAWLETEDFEKISKLSQLIKDQQWHNAKIMITTSNSAQSYTRNWCMEK